MTSISLKHTVLKGVNEGKQIDVMDTFTKYKLHHLQEPLPLVEVESLEEIQRYVPLGYELVTDQNMVEAITQTPGMDYLPIFGIGESQSWEAVGMYCDLCKWKELNTRGYEDCAVTVSFNHYTLHITASLAEAVRLIPAGFARDATLQGLRSPRWYREPVQKANCYRVEVHYVGKQTAFETLRYYPTSPQYKNQDSFVLLEDPGASFGRPVLLSSMENGCLAKPIHSAECPQWDTLVRCGLIPQSSIVAIGNEWVGLHIQVPSQVKVSYEEMSNWYLHQLDPDEEFEGFEIYASSDHIKTAPTFKEALESIPEGFYEKDADILSIRSGPLEPTNDTAFEIWGKLHNGDLHLWATYLPFVETTP